MAMIRTQDYQLFNLGGIITLWRIILLLSKARESWVDLSEIVLIIQRKAYFGGTVPITQSIDLGMQYQLINVKDGKISLSEYTDHNLLPFCSEENPNIEIIRRIIQKILITRRYFWLLSFSEDIEVFKAYLPSEWTSLLHQAQLLNFNEESVITWWSDLLAQLQTIDEKRLKEIGDVGELLTVKFERKRLTKEGYRKIDLLVKWISRLDNSSGYDINSIRGKLLKIGTNDKEDIFIEVKASVFSTPENFRFIISRNECEKAIKFSDLYFFYCWVGVNVNNKTSTEGPFIIPSTRIIKSFPKDTDPICKWTECAFVINLKKFSI